MGASLSILLTVLAQAAAPTAPACNPPCAAGQYCAPNGQCYVPAPAPPPPSPPGAYAPAQNPPPPTYYPPAQTAPPPPTYYPPAQTAPPPGYYAPPPQQGYPQNPPPQQPYPQSGGYPPGAYGSPPPGVYQPQVVPVRESAPYKEGPRFGLFLGGIVVPGTDVTAAAGGAMLTFGSRHHGFETRIYGALYKVEDEDTTTTGSAAFVHGTRWWGVYGLGFGSGIGYADFNAKTTYGWSDSSAQVIAYIAPVMLRFGRQPTFEVGLNSGATVIFSHDVRPYGYLYGAILF